MPIREVRITDYFEQAIPLMRENWSETGFNFELNPDIGRYQQLQDAGLVFALAAFDGDELVGYSSAAVVPHPFNPSILYCATDALFVAKSHRKGSIPGRLITETERIAKQRGAHLIAWHTRTGTPLAAIFTDRNGYQPGDSVVFKEL